MLGVGLLQRPPLPGLADLLLQARDRVGDLVPLAGPLRSVGAAGGGLLGGEVEEGLVEPPVLAEAVGGGAGSSLGGGGLLLPLGEVRPVGARLVDGRVAVRLRDLQPLEQARHFGPGLGGRCMSRLRSFLRLLQVAVGGGAGVEGLAQGADAVRQGRAVLRVSSANGLRSTPTRSSRSARRCSAARRAASALGVPAAHSATPGGPSR